MCSYIGESHSLLEYWISHIALFSWNPLLWYSISSTRIIPETFMWVIGYKISYIAYSCTLTNASIVFFDFVILMWRPLHQAWMSWSGVVQNLLFKAISTFRCKESKDLLDRYGFFEELIDRWLLTRTASVRMTPQGSRTSSFRYVLFHLYFVLRSRNESRVRWFLLLVVQSNVSTNSSLLI